MTWGRTLEDALASKGISKEFKEWIAIAKDQGWAEVETADSLQTKTS